MMKRHDARISPHGELTVRSAGDLGDGIFSLPAVKYLCARDNRKAVFFIEAANYTRERLTPDNWRGLDRILKCQPYISDVREFTGGAVDVNLNDFRQIMFSHLRRGLHKDRHISDWVAMAHNLPVTIKDEPWLTIETVKVAPVVINRTGPGRHPGHVYHGVEFPWGRVLKKYGKDAVFIGTPLEHEVFCAVQGEVPFHPTLSLFEAAQVIAGCELFIGNQSACHAIAQGVGKRIILEVWEAGPNCLATRLNVLNVRDMRAVLPDL